MTHAANLAALIAMQRTEGRLVEPAAQDQAEADLERWSRQGIAVLSAADPRYPEQLRGVSGAPALLFLRGQLQPEETTTVAVVGTRRPSPEGLRDAEEAARRLALGGATVVSGLAQGIDTAAHTAALAATGRTVAVLGTGLEHAYPPQNAELQDRIAARGALISQFWPEQAPAAENFRVRNALMASLTCATVIVEAHSTSGTRIAARHALHYGRKLILFERLLAQPWAREFASRDGVAVVARATEIFDALRAMASPSGHGG